MADQLDISASLVESFGITVPEPFVRLVKLAYDAARDSDGFINRHDFILYPDFMFDFGAVVTHVIEDDDDDGWEPSGGTGVIARPSGSLATPPELLVFGGPGGSDIEYGFVVHAPELAAADYPLGQFQPSGRKEVHKLGDDTRGGLEHLMSERLRWWTEDPDDDPPQFRGKTQARIDAIADALGIQPTAERGDPGLGQVIPAVPPGWRYVPSSDGVGALAPAGAFASHEQVIGERDDPLEPVIEDAIATIEAGYPATALLGIRDTFWHTYLNKQEAFTVLEEAWGRAYLELGRPLLARALAWKTLN